MKGIYRPDLKSRFLNEYENENTQQTYKYLFEKSYQYEKTFFEKDLSMFTLEQIEKFLTDIKPLTINVARSHGRIISAYTNWAITQDDIDVSVNPLKDIPTSFYNQFVDKSAKLFFTKDEIDDIEKDLVNAQDASILYMIFETGVLGNDFSEMLNLKKQDVDFENNILHLEDDELGKRDVEVSTQCIKLIKDAINETEYHGRNGEGRRSKLVSNNYVIRAPFSKKTNLDRADKHLIYRRISTISDIFGYIYMSAKNIERSGMIYMAYNLLKEGKYTEITNEMLTEIGDKFRMKKSIVNGEKNYNFYLMRDYINLEIINDLYGNI
ncbi:site-specific integrase [Schinkia azotoformans]|uniref:site-specific integrase n=1 Tax=Schinkia azotoformans TaxID=1454 RepID=UPI002DB62368|nr:site-specific integrase [Schinkia azotoformans]MEC1726948.1 site-specific integrase [Schinkia azotoformans]